VSSQVIRTHTERLEKVIKQGEELRDDMRKKIVNLEKTIRAQRAEILNATRAKELYQRRLTHYKRTLVAEREKRQKLEGQIIKLKRRIGSA
jgi:chromosome segregation ATPase